MQVVEEELVVPDQGIAVLEVRPAVAEGLHLRPHEGDPRLVGLIEEIIDPGPLVLTDGLFRCFFFCHVYYPVLPSS